MSAEAPITDDQTLWKPDYQKAKTVELIVKTACGFFAVISVLTTAGIIGTLIFETVEFFSEVPFWRFLTDTSWKPLFNDPAYGIIVLISGTLLTSSIATSVAIPLGLLSAIFLSEYSSLRVRKILKPILEILAGVGL